MSKQTLILRRRRDLEKAARIIINGGLVVFPTETVYGLGANALDSNAVASIFSAKGRPQDNPLIVHFANTSLFEKFGFQASALEKKLFNTFSPGPLTLILQRPENFPSIVSGGLDSLAVRIPAHPVAQEFLCLCQCPVAAPSANLSGRPSPTDFEMAFAAMNRRTDAIIDGGSCEVGLESTVIRVTDDTHIQVLRPGGISPDQLREAVGNDIVIVSTTDMRENRHSPGTRYPHYKPRAKVALWKDAWQRKELPKRIGLLILKQSSDKLDAFMREYPDAIIKAQLFENTEDYARAFYKALIEMDRSGVDIILCETVLEKGIGLALMNRMRRAAGLE